MEGASIKIYVGADEKLYTAPRALLCYHSAFFQCCLSGQFKEATENAVRLDEDDPETFLLVLEWMHKGTLQIFEDCWRDFHDRPAGLRQTCRVLCKLSVMADKLQMNGIQGYVFSELDRAMRHAGDYFPMDSATVMAVYNNTREHSKLQQYVLESLAHNLISPSGHHITEYQECVEGPNAIPGFALKLIAKMKDFRSHEYWCKAKF